MSACSPPTTGLSGELGEQSILCSKVSLDLKMECLVLCLLHLLLEGHVDDDPSLGNCMGIPPGTSGCTCTHTQGLPIPMLWIWVSPVDRAK